METLTRSLVHDGRFVESASLRKEAEGYKYFFRPEWFRQAVTEKNWADAEKIISEMAKTDKATRSYFTAVMFLERGMPERAKPEIDVLRQGNQSKRNDRQRDLRLWEVQGRYECQTGNGEAGVKLLKRTIDKTKDDYAHHAWGGGAYYMETWGTAALEAGIATQAEEAFQEALAHDAGSVRGALGLWALCDRLGRTDEAVRHPPVDWRDVLRAFVAAAACNDYSWSRPNRRFVWQGLYLPGLHSEDIGEVVIAIDTSGSVGDRGPVISFVSGDMGTAVAVNRQHLRAFDLRTVSRSGSTPPSSPRSASSTSSTPRESPGTPTSTRSPRSDTASGSE